MKTLTFLSTLTFCILSFQLTAQFSVGIRGGYIKAWEEYGDVAIPAGANIYVHGFQLSGLAYYGLSKTFSIGFEPGYAQRGAACVPEFITFNGDAKLLFNYIELPLIISAKYPVLKEKMVVIGKAGYGISKVIKGYTEYKVPGSEEPEKNPINFDNPFGTNVTRWDNGIYSGLGLGYNLGRSQLLFESVFYLGMKNVDKNATSLNRSIHFGLGYLIRL